MHRFLLIVTTLLSTLSLQSCKEGDVPATVTITAHRGGAKLGNENTLSCIERGIASGAELVEIDVHLTKDGQVVVCHDPSIDRTTTGKGMIEDMTLEQVRSFKIKDAAGQETQECIPTLEEVLELINGRCMLLLEIKLNHKDQYPGISRKAIDAVNAAGMHDKTIFQSFNDIILEDVHALDPTLRVEKLIVCRLPFGLCFDGRLTRFSFDKYAYAAAINPCVKVTSQRFVKDAHKAGKEVRIWTVDKWSRLIPHVDGIITNDPEMFVQKRKQAQ